MHTFKIIQKGIQREVEANIVINKAVVNDHYEMPQDMTDWHLILEDITQELKHGNLIFGDIEVLKN